MRVDQCGLHVRVPQQFLHGANIDAAFKHFAIEKQQCGKSLTLRGRRDLARDRQMREKRFNLCCTHVEWVPLTVKQDEPFDPCNIRFFRAGTVMQVAQAR